MSFNIKSLSTQGLPRLPFDLRVLISKNEGKVRNALNRAARLNGLGYTRELAEQYDKSLGDPIKRNNPNISEDEIRAWVWYRRSIGIPMNGWEKYFIASSGKQAGKGKTNVFAPGCLIRTTRDTKQLDRDWHPSTLIPAGSNCGSWTGREHKSNDNKTYLFCRSSEGILIVCKDDVTPVASGVTQKDDDITRLVKKGCLFYCDGELLPYPVYVYANLYDRTLQLRADKEHIVEEYGQAAYEHQEKAIKDVMPQKLSIFNPIERERPQILVNSRFAWDFKIKSVRDEAGIELGDKEDGVSLTEAFEKWLCYSVRRSDMQSTVSPQDVLKYYVRNSPLTDKSANGAKDRARKAKIKGECRAEGERLFRLFLHTMLTTDDQQRLDMTWNRLYNGYPTLPYDRVPVMYKISPRFKGRDLEIRPAQREGVAFMEIAGSGIVAYDVGVGKTITAIIEVASAMQNGKCRRPLIVVPRSTYPNWLKEIGGDGEGSEGILTGMGIKINDWGNLSKVNPERFASIPENTITVVTYQGFEKMGFDFDKDNDFLRELAQIMLDAGEERETASARESSAQIQKLLAMVGMGRKGMTCCFDKCGFDYLVIDEAHNFKNVFVQVKQKKSSKGFTRRGFSEGAQSTRAVKAFFANNYIQRKFGRNVMLLTATPFTNHPIEIFSMLSHVGMKALKDAGYYNIGEFFEMFCEVETEDGVDIAGKVTTVDVVKRFNNREILQRLIYNHINYKTGEEAGVRRPVKVNLPRINALDDNGIMQRLPPNKQTLTYLKMTDEQYQNQRDIINSISDPDDDRHYTADGQKTLKALNNSLNNALHPCLYNGDWPATAVECIERSPKLQYVCECIRSVKQWHERRGEDVSGQVVYLNRGLNLIPFIQEYLLDEVGFKRNVEYGRLHFDEVEVISGSTGERKEDIMTAFNAGVVKVIIGTKTICEGVNLQSRSTCLYNLYPDWNPTDIKQLEGRIWRQGNRFNFTRIVLPLVQDSMDVFVFQKIGEKTSRINDIWAKGTRGNVFEVDSLDPEEIKYALMTDVRALALSLIEKEKAALQTSVAILQDRFNALQAYQSEDRSLNTYRSQLREQCKNFLKKFEGSTYNGSNYDIVAKQVFYFLQNRPLRDDKSTWLSTWQTKNDYDKIANLAGVIDSIRATIAKPELADSEYIDLCAKIQRLRAGLFVSGVSDYLIDAFKVCFKKVMSLKKSTLVQYNLNNDDEVEKAKNEMEEQLNTLKSSISAKDSEAYLDAKVVEVQKRKQELSVVGSTPDDALKGFEALNYLMAYPFDPNNDGHSIPEPGETPKPAAPSSSPSESDDKARRRRLLRLRAKAVQISLKLNYL